MDNLQVHLNLYKSLFKGREDIFAIRWEKGDKNGYMPACFYDPYRLKVHKMSGGTFQNYTDKSYLKLNDEQILKHLNGQQFIGIYPLLPENNSWFIAADFDKKNWQEDCQKFLKICEEHHMPAYIERSRSGNGGHVWIFFDQPYPAFKSRKIILTLLETAGIFSSFDKNTSFDRLFPNQDYLSGKGFGNLIALPFYGPSLQQSNSCFINPDTFISIEDQWGFLTTIKRASIKAMDGIFSSISDTKSVNISDSDKLIIQLDNTVQINRSGLSPALISFLKEELNFFNAEYAIKKNSARNTFGTERYFRFIDELPNCISIPKGFIGTLISFCLEKKIAYELQDNRKLLPAIPFTFNSSLRKYQLPAIQASDKKNFGVIVSPPGSGKTVIGLKIIADKQQPALIIVHRKQLADQWLERIEAFLGIPKQEIGTIGQGKTKIGKHITIALIQSLSKEVQKPDVTKLVRAFGTILVDECHHVASETFRNTVNKFHSYYIYGLTATPFRKYNSGKLIFIHLGKIISEVKPDEIETFKHPEIIIRNTELEVPFNAKTDKFETLSKILVHDSARNRLILSDIISELNKGKKAVILTERKEHIETLQQYLKQTFETVTLSGEDSESSRRDKWKILKTGNYQVLITTGQFFGEGSDLHNAQCLFLVYPFSFEGKLIQYIGRVQRSEITPTIFDYRDIKIDYLNRLFLKRNTYYRKLERHITLFDEPTEDDIKTEAKNEKVIERCIKVRIEELEFLYGCIIFRANIEDIQQVVDFDIENLNIRPEFDVLKPYFEKFLGSKSVSVNICIIYENEAIVAQIASSADINKLDREIIESVRFRFIEKSFIKKNATLPVSSIISQQGSSGDGQALYESGEELLKDILAKGKYRHHRQLRYFSEQHKGSILKIRFVLSPFAFVFLLEGIEHYHVIMETLDTDEATYIWHIPKNITALENALVKIDQHLNKIRNDGRLVFLQTLPESFSRVLHDYSDERKGFVIWKDTLEERIT